MSADAIVIGGGHNGLVAATRLARSGRKVLLLEARDEVGGIAAGRGFHPGHRHVGEVIDTAELRPHVVEGLGLRAHGLKTRTPPPCLVTAGEGTGILLHAEADRAQAELAQHAPADAAGLAALVAFIDRIRPFAASVLDAPAPVIGEEAQLWPLVQRAIGLRRLGRQDMMELLRVAPAASVDWVTEHVSSPAIVAGLLAPALLGTWMGPRSPQSTSALLRRLVLAGDEVVGGPAALVEALRAAAGAAGVEIRTGALVERIRVGQQGVEGVALAGGETVEASVVLACCSPRQALLDLVDPLWLPALVERDALRIRTRGITAVLHLALSGPLRFAARGDLVVERALVAAGPDDLEHAFDDAKHRRLPARPVLDVRVPSVSDPSLAPEGHQVATILVRGVAADLDGGWTDQAREELLSRVLDTLGAAVPDVRDRVVGHELSTPTDLASRLRLDGGHLAHGELALDQLWVMRPTPALSRHATPIAGLYLGSSGTHPGGVLTGASGWLAAEAVTGRAAR